MTHTVYRHAAGLGSGLTRGRRRVTAVAAIAALAGGFAVALPVLVGTAAQAAPPLSATDSSKVPHYFGPWPNWALSPLPQSNATVTISDGQGSGALATATIDGNGTITGITLVAGGADYNAADVTITDPNGIGSGALATATVDASGVITAVTLDAGGSGYSAADVTFNDASVPGGGATASATIDPLSGGITSIDVTNPGEGYVTAPKVVITGGDGTATAHATVTTSGSLTGFSVTAGGGGYFGFDVALTGGGANGGEPTVPATVQGTGKVDVVTITSGGAGYTMPTVEFDLPDLPSGIQATGHVTVPGMPDYVATDPGLDPDTGAIRKVTIDNPGSGYLTAPAIAIHNGTAMDPISGATLAKAKTTLTLDRIEVSDLGSGYVAAPSVAVTDIGGAGAGAQAQADFPVKGTVSAITVDTPGAGFLAGGIKKFQDQLPLYCDPALSDCTAAKYTATLGNKYIPAAVPLDVTYSNAQNNFSTEHADQYVIGLVQYRTQFNTDLPATLARGYVQIETPELDPTGATAATKPTAFRADGSAISQHVPLVNKLLDGTEVAIKDAAGNTVYGVTPPQWLGPFINAKKDKPVRVVFHNYLPTGTGGNLFLPTDSTMMGSGMAPMSMGTPTNDSTVVDQVRNPTCTQEGKSAARTASNASECFSDNRALLHLHGGMTPWISDGTPHQWITPAGEGSTWPKGVGVTNVPDMVDGTGAQMCAANDSGCETYYYTNQQSARLMWYHDHSWGVTRLNVYVGEAAGYTITDSTEQALVDSGTIPGPADTLPLVVQDRTFVPSDQQLYDMAADGTVLKGNHPVTDAASLGQDPTWDAARWGTMGSFWYHHVYMPAQNPGDASGMSAYGRWMYGPWFWPPASGTKYGPIQNPYYDAGCKVDDPTTWTYQTDPFCEPELIPGTPNVAAGMEQFNDTPIVNGVAYPTITLDPKSYRLRILNAANDRFFNLQWYTADTDPANGGSGTVNDPVTGKPTGTEVKLKAAELAAAQTDPVVVPTPEGSNNNAYGPDWVQIANESGFLPTPAVIDGQQPTTWITDPTRFDVGNVDLHSMLLAPAERSDVIVDFSKFAGKTLIMYNDAPAAFPARVPSYDYYTGQPDLSPNGAPGVKAGYGPNTRTIMQVKIAPLAPAPAFSLTKLNAAFKHHVDGSGVFESGQNPVIVGQAGYNTAYGTSFAGTANCNNGSTSTTCDGALRVNDTGSFSFNTLKAPTAKMTMGVEPKAIHDEMNSSTFDEFGRMQANLGLEAQPPTPGAQNVTLYPYVNPPTELIDGTNLQAANVKATPISTASDGTQIWRITHNGVDTHPIHFHLFDVQLLNRVTWDNIIIPPDPNELGWKDTVRMSPLEDTIVALRPQVPVTPFEVPNSVRPLNPMMPTGNTDMFNNVAPDGTPSTAITNQLVNFGWEYVFHCHILSHEEMDMMRPVSLALPPLKPGTLTRTTTGSGNTLRNVISFVDSSITETAYVLQRTTDGTTWTNAGTSVSPLNVANTKGGTRSITDTTGNASTTTYTYRVAAQNTVGYGAEFPSLTATSYSPTVVAGSPPPAPSNAQANLRATGIEVTWRDNSTNESGFAIERQLNGGAWTPVTTAPAVAGTGNGRTFTDTTITQAGVYRYRVAAVNAAGTSAFAQTGTVTVNPTAAPTQVTAQMVNGTGVRVRFRDNANNETGFLIERSANGGGTWQPAGTVNASNGTGNTVTFVDTGVPVSGSYVYRVGATGLLGTAWSVQSAAVNAVAAPSAPTVTGTSTPTAGNRETLTVNWTAVTGATGYTVRYSANANGNGATTRNLGGNTLTTNWTNLQRRTYYVQVTVTTNGGTATSGWVAVP